MVVAVPVVAAAEMARAHRLRRQERARAHRLRHQDARAHRLRHQERARAHRLRHRGGEAEQKAAEKVMAYIDMAYIVMTYFGVTLFGTSQLFGKETRGNSVSNGSTRYQFLFSFGIFLCAFVVREARHGVLRFGVCGGMDPSPGPGPLIRLWPI